MTGLTEALDRLAPADGWEADWTDVLRRAGEPGPLPAARRPVRRRRRGRRRTVVLALVILAIAVPLTALSALNNWWRSAGLPRPVQKPLVVTHGSWSGHAWTLIAYPSYPDSTDYGLCYGVTFSSSPDVASVPPGGTISSRTMARTGVGNDIACGSIVGIQKRFQTPGLTPTVAFSEPIYSSARTEGPAWIAGVVIPRATHVVIRWSAKKAAPPAILASPREVVRVATFPAGIAGYHVRLFAAPVPQPLLRHTRTAGADPYPDSFSGRDSNGRFIHLLWR